VNIQHLRTASEFLRETNYLRQAATTMKCMRLHFSKASRYDGGSQWRVQTFG